MRLHLCHARDLGYLLRIFYGYEVMAPGNQPLYDEFRSSPEDEERFFLERVSEKKNRAGYEYHEGEDQHYRDVFELSPREGLKRIIEYVYMSAYGYLLITVMLVPRVLKSGGHTTDPDGKCSKEPG